MNNTCRQRSQFGACWFLLWAFGGTFDWSSTSVNTVHAWSLLAKTKETFKLSDLQWLEFRLELPLRGWECERLLVDQATGSSLMLLQSPQPVAEGADLGLLIDFLPCLERCDWVGRILVNQTTTASTTTASPESFVQQVSKVLGAGCSMDLGPWTLKYFAFHQAAQDNNNNGSLKKPHEYTQTSLICAVAQAIDGPPAALNPQSAKDRLLLVDAFARGRFLLQRLQLSATGHDDACQRFIQNWSGRPFAYSSALNPVVACIVTDLILGLVQRQLNTDDSVDTTILDPTCGSGSFLACALFMASQQRASFGRCRAVGWDINPKCVEGTTANLQYMVNATTSNEFLGPAWDVSCRDSAIATNGVVASDPLQIGRVDAVMANLPWGRNSVRYANEDVAICKGVREFIRSRSSNNSQRKRSIPCAFVFRHHTANNVTQLLDEHGFEVLGVAHVPPLGRKLPNSRKQKRNEPRTTVAAESPTSSSDCAVVIAQLHNNA